MSVIIYMFMYAIVYIVKRVVKLRVTEAGFIAGFLSGKGFSFGKVSLQPDSNPSDRCENVKAACQTVTLPQ